MNKKIISASILAASMLPMIAMAGLTEGDFEPPGVQNVSLIQIIIQIVDIVWWVFIGISIVMFIIAGITFLTAQGDEEGTRKARMFVIYGFVGIVVAILAFSASAIVKQTFGFA